MSGREFTGTHMAIWICSFFGVVIAVNIVLAVFANSTWTGLIVKNGYVASQEYNGVLAQARAQASRGWNAALSRNGDQLKLELTGPDGNPIQGLAVTAKVSRPIHENENDKLDFEAAANDGYVARLDLAPGQWDIDVTASGGTGPEWRRIWRLWIEPPKS